MTDLRLNAFGAAARAKEQQQAKMAEQQKELRAQTKRGGLKLKPRKTFQQIAEGIKLPPAVATAKATATAATQATQIVNDSIFVLPKPKQ